jgi:hypothetical protein
MLSVFAVIHNKMVPFPLWMIVETFVDASNKSRPVELTLPTPSNAAGFAPSYCLFGYHCAAVLPFRFR